MERTIDQQIEDHHREVEQSEHDALAIDNRLRGVGGLDQYMAQPRPYGTLRNPWSGAGNVTAQTLIMQQDRALATSWRRRRANRYPLSTMWASSSVSLLHSNARRWLTPPLSSARRTLPASSAIRTRV